MEREKRGSARAFVIIIILNVVIVKMTAAVMNQTHHTRGGQKPVLTHFSTNLANSFTCLYTASYRVYYYDMTKQK